MGGFDVKLLKITFTQQGQNCSREYARIRGHFRQGPFAKKSEITKQVRHGQVQPVGGARALNDAQFLLTS